MKSFWRGFRAGIRETEVSQTFKVGALIGGAAAVIGIIVLAAM